MIAVRKAANRGVAHAAVLLHCFYLVSRAALLLINT